MDTSRITKKSVTCFLRFEDDFLFIHRTKKGNDTDANRLNGVGGKLEYGEDFLSAAVREVFEETGYVVQKDDCALRAIVNMQGGYTDDWVICFFVMTVSTKEVPTGLENSEGELLWLHKDNVLTSGYELVDDLNYCWNDLANTDKMLFIGAEVNEQEKIEKISIQTI